MATFDKWIDVEPSHGDCVVTGCDAKYEWMLKWWYKNYAEHNRYNIIFADFGMSRQAREWCAKHGKIIDIRFGIRKNWFKKPIALLKTPYQRMIWMDLDCEVRGDLSPMFKFADVGVGVTLDPHNPHVKQADPVASGIIVCKFGDPLIEEWAHECIYDRTRKRGDQEVFNMIIEGNRDSIAIMPPEYQWLRLDGDKKDALVMHWTGTKGKNIIKAQMRRDKLTIPADMVDTGNTVRKISKSVTMRANQISKVNNRAGLDSIINIVRGRRRVVRSPTRHSGK